MILMRAERLITPAPVPAREPALEVENIALKARVAALEAELARFKGTGTMIELEAYAALSRVVKAAAAVGGSTVDELNGLRRNKRIVLLRQAAMFVAYRDVGRLSYPQIARHLGDRDHTTVLHGVRRIEADIAEGIAETITLVDDIRRAAGVGVKAGEEVAKP